MSNPQDEREVLYPSRDGLTLRATCKSAEGASRGGGVLAHGITGDREQGGLYSELAARLARRGLGSLRFDFRGHGQSGGAQEAITVAGEVSDLAASVDWLHAHQPAPLCIVASSFGAVSACQYVAQSDGIACLVLLNPVLDLRRTFLEPEVLWPKQSFNAAGFEHLEEHGFLWLDGHFKIGRALVDEMRTCAPYQQLARLEIPVLTLHGDEDTCVPHAVSQLHGVPNPRSRFVTIPGADHGFGRPHERELVLASIMDFLSEHLPA